MFTHYSPSGQEIPIYIGKSRYSCQNRIHRFIKEILEQSRHDEDFPGAKKFRDLCKELKVPKIKEVTVRYADAFYFENDKRKLKMDEHLKEVRDTLISQFNPAFNIKSAFVDWEELEENIEMVY